MQKPLKIIFHGLAHSDAIENNIRKKVEKLETIYPRLTACRVVIDAEHHHQHQGNLYQVKVELSVPNNDIIVSHDQHDKHEREDAYVAIRDAFDAAKRKLEDYSNIQHRRKKLHQKMPRGKVSKLIPEEDYGIIETLDGNEVYFHRNSVVDSDYDALKIGAEIRFAEQQDPRGLRASSVHVISKRHTDGI